MKNLISYFILVILFCDCCTQAVAAENLTEDRLNYGFATYLGSGIYHAGDQDVQVYQLPLSYTMTEPAPHQYGIKLHFPVTLGFFNIKTSDIVENGLPDHVSTYSVVPGVEIDIPIHDQWLLSPFFDYGFANNSETNEVSKIISSGIKSRYTFLTSQATIVLGNNFLYATQHVDNGKDLDYASFETGLDFQFQHFNFLKYHLANFNLYYMNFRYFNDLEFLRVSNRPVEVTVQNEVGFTFGIKYFQNARYIDIPRIGIGYRAGDGMSAYRLVLGLPF